MKMLISAMSILLIAGCTDEVMRVFPLEPAAALGHGHANVVGTTLILEIEGVEDLTPENRWVAWAVSDAGEEALDAVEAETRLEIDLAGLNTPAESIEEILITEEADDTTLPTSPSSREFMHGEFPGDLHMLGLDESSFAAAMAEVHLDGDEIEITASGLPSLPTGFAYRAWLTHHDAESEMPMSIGELGGGAFLQNELNDVASTAHSVMVTIESDNGVDMMSPVTALHGEVVLTAEGGSAPEPAEPPGHTH